MPMSRRRALVALGAMGTLALGIATIPQWRRIISPARVIDVGQLAKGLMPMSRDERADLGRAIIQRDSSRDYAREIAGTVHNTFSLRGSELLGPRDTDRAVAALAQQSKADFATGRIVKIDRWYLSRTQADVLAIAAQQADAPRHTIGGAA